MKQDRLTQIKHLLMRDQQVINTELCEIFGVSIATIRRDLDQLEAEGIITRIYGGARLAISPAHRRRRHRSPAGVPVLPATCRKSGLLLRKSRI